MAGANLRNSAYVVLWSVITAAAMLATFVPIGVAAGLGQWWILRSRLHLGRASAIPFALSFPAGQFPSYLMYLAVYASGFGGFDGPPEWFVTVTLATGGLLAGMCQFLGLPKTWRNFGIWPAATCLAWAVTALGDLHIRGMLMLSALFSGLITGVAMLTLSPRQHDKSHPGAGRARLSGMGVRTASTRAAGAAGLTGGRR